MTDLYRIKPLVWFDGPRSSVSGEHLVYMEGDSPWWHWGVARFQFREDAKNACERNHRERLMHHLERADA